MAKLTTAQRMKQNKPVEIWERDGWKWEVYKKYQKIEKEIDNPYARWFCKVTSPFTQGTADWGDTYISDIKNAGAEQIYKEVE